MPIHQYCTMSLLLTESVCITVCLIVSSIKYDQRVLTFCPRTDPSHVIRSDTSHKWWHRRQNAVLQGEYTLAGQSVTCPSVAWMHRLTAAWTTLWRLNVSLLSFCRTAPVMIFVQSALLSWRWTFDALKTRRVMSHRATFCPTTQEWSQWVFPPFIRVSENWILQSNRIELVHLGDLQESRQRSKWLRWTRWWAELIKFVCTCETFQCKHFFLTAPFEHFPLSFIDIIQTFCWWSYAKVKNCGSGRTPRKALVRNMPSGTRQQGYPSSMTRTMPWGTQSTLALRSGTFSLLYVFCVCGKKCPEAHSLMTWSTVLLWFSGQRVNTQRSRRMKFRPPMIPLENQNGEKDLPYTWR